MQVDETNELLKELQPSLDSKIDELRKTYFGLEITSEMEKIVTKLKNLRLQEDPLIPVVVIRGAGNDFPGPVDHRPHLSILGSQPVDVVECPLGWMDIVSDSGIFRGQPDRIEAHRKENVVAPHSLEPCEDIRHRKRVPVADMQNS